MSPLSFTLPLTPFNPFLISLHLFVASSPSLPSLSPSSLPLFCLSLSILPPSPTLPLHPSSLFPLDITIGFTPDSYQVDENAARVVLNVSLITGLLQRPVEVVFTVTNGTAFSMCDVLMYNVIATYACYTAEPLHVCNVKNFQRTASIIGKLYMYL